MATLRSLLVNHITETHDARIINGKLAGPNLLEALQERQQQHTGAQGCAAVCVIAVATLSVLLWYKARASKQPRHLSTCLGMSHTEGTHIFTKTTPHMSAIPGASQAVAAAAGPAAAAACRPAAQAQTGVCSPSWQTRCSCLTWSAR
jgi:hypothetical protein